MIMKPPEIFSEMSNWWVKGGKMKKTIAFFLVVAVFCIVISCGTQQGQESVKKNEGPVEIGVYNMYDLDTYMRPIWKDRVIHNETVMFVGQKDEISLLYEADEILSVRSYDLKTEYKKGVDYDYADGKMVLVPGTSIPCISETEYYTNDPAYSMLITTENEARNGQYTYWGEEDSMTKWQVAVTYTHSQFWEGFTPTCYKDRYQNLIQKLENGEDVTFVFYGDSITYGANASFIIGQEPYAPSWSQMFTQYVAKKYGYTVTYLQEGHCEAPVPAEDTVYGSNGIITYINPSVGGWAVEHGYQNVDAHVNDLIDKYGCDLFTVAFGMNNASLSAKKLRQYTEAIVGKVQEHAPETAVALIATMVPNPEATNGWYGNQYTFEEELLATADAYNEAGTSCATVCMTSMSQSVLENKRFRDYTGNNINHPNDFMSRLYAQTMMETVFGYN